MASSKQPAILFYTGDWLKDPAVSLCSPATRGIWVDFLCAMHESNRSGVITGSRQQLARVGRCSTVELDQALSELTLSNAAEITERNKTITIINRRMKRENAIREARSLAGQKGMKRRWHNKNPNESVTPLEDVYVNEDEIVNKYTLQEVKEANLGILTDEEAEVFFYYFNGQGWKWPNKLPVGDLPSALQRWKRNRPRFEKKEHQKVRLLPIAGKMCSVKGCGMPAVFRDTSGSYDRYMCRDHLPEKIKSQYD